MPLFNMGVLSGYMDRGACEAVSTQGDAAEPRIQPNMVVASSEVAPSIFRWRLYQSRKIIGIMFSPVIRHKNDMYYYHGFQKKKAFLWRNAYIPE